MPRPLTVAIAVALFGPLVVAFDMTPGPDCWPGYSTGDGTWPLGARECEGHRASGAHYRWTEYPWHDWAAVAGVAVSAGLFTYALARPRSRMLHVGSAAVALFWATVLAWFIEAALVWAVLLALVAASVAQARRRAAPA